MSNHKFWIILVTASLFIIGCTDRTPTITKKPVQTVEETNTTKIYVPQRIHKKIKLKEVQDDNYASAYMYPEDKVKKEKPVEAPTPPIKTETATVAATGNVMNKEECIGMIGQEKFDKYTQMFGNETSSIKRCAMLKAMQ